MEERKLKTVTETVANEIHSFADRKEDESPPNQSPERRAELNGDERRREGDRETHDQSDFFTNKVKPDFEEQFRPDIQVLVEEFEGREIDTKRLKHILSVYSSLTGLRRIAIELDELASDIET